MSEYQPLLPQSEGMSTFNESTPNLQCALDDTSVVYMRGIDLPKSNYNASSQRSLEYPTSNWDTMIHLLKGNIGTGILAMPRAFKIAGLYVGLFGTLIIGAICTHCMYMLVKCSHELCQRLRQPALSFSEVAYYSFDTGPNGMKRYSKFARGLITTFLCITQIGACCVYFVFVAFNVKEVVSAYYPDNGVNIQVYLTIILIPMIPLNFVRNLKYLTPVSLVATALTVFGLVITFFYILHHLPHTSTVKPFASWSSLPIYFSTAIYSFEGIGIVLPLENNMKTPKDFGGMNGVLSTAMTIVTCLYTAVGFFGYLKYGEDVKDSITLNLPSHELFSNLVRLAMAIAVFFSYALQFYVPMNIFYPVVQNCLEHTRFKDFADPILRVSLTVFTFLLAICIPDLGLIIALVGAIGSSTLALIVPPIIEIATFWQYDLGRYNWLLWKDILILIFGLCGFALGTYQSVLAVFKQ